MTEPCCRACGGARDPSLVGVLPCEWCAAPPDAVEELPIDPEPFGGRRRVLIITRPPEEAQEKSE